MQKNVLYTITILLFYLSSYSQQPETTALNRFTITRSDTLTVFYASEPDKKIQVLRGRSYYWYSRDTILITEEGYDGKLLDGDYTVYYPNGNLKEQGAFSNGLKTGEWKYWQTDGVLQVTESWRRGERTAIRQKTKTKLKS